MNPEELGARAGHTGGEGWLSLLFEAYKIIDNGTREAIAAHEKKSNVLLACKKGCFYCCKTHRDIPVYLHELTGIYWYILERMPSAQKEILKLQLLTHKKGDPCPFLIDRLCSIHPLRPAACRQFNVFNKPCASGEDPFYTRRQDVLTPPRNILLKAFLQILPFYGLKDRNHGIQMIEDFINSQALNLRDIDWRALARRI